jgi:hypothetical protein
VKILVIFFYYVDFSCCLVVKLLLPCYYSYSLLIPKPTEILMNSNFNINMHTLIITLKIYYF